LIEAFPKAKFEESIVLNPAPNASAPNTRVCPVASFESFNISTLETPVNALSSKVVAPVSSKVSANPPSPSIVSADVKVFAAILIVSFPVPELIVFVPVPAVMISFPLFVLIVRLFPRSPASIVTV